jgi:hypothetical protein
MSLQQNIEVVGRHNFSCAAKFLSVLAWSRRRLMPQPYSLFQVICEKNFSEMRIINIQDARGGVPHHGYDSSV